MIATIIPESKSYKIDKFSYLIPKDLTDLIEIGSIVEIQFGKNTMRGLVFDIIEEKSVVKNEKYSLKEIISVESDYTISEKFFPIIEWISAL